MGVAVPQVITETKASGAQVIDGSVNFFQESNPFLEFTPGSDGNRSTWTISFWAKVDPNTTSTYNPFTLASSDSYSWEYEGLHYAGNNLYYIDYISQGSGSNILWRTNAKFTDTGWYHFMAVKVNNSTFKLYVNGEEQTSLSSNTNNGNQSSHWNKSGQKMFLGGAKFSSEYSSHSPGMSQFYFIDGQALAPTDFAFTDPLTNTWRPKKYTGTFTGTNTCYLPFDGNSPIGQDKSGNGNDWTPRNFFSGGSVTLDKATGALPILNTTVGGGFATPGVFGSKENKTVTVTVASKTGGGNAYFFDSVERDSLATIRGSTITFDTTDSTNNSHPFKLSSTNADSSGGTEYTDGVAYYINGSTVTGSNYVSNYSNNGGGSGFRGIKWTVPHNVSTTYYYCTVHNGMGEGGRLTSTTDETKADPYAWKCVLACPLVGSNVDVSNQINATSTTKVMTTEGNAYASTNTNQFYGGSFEFDGTGDGISTPDNTDFEFGSGDFTVECWVKQDDTSGFDQFVGKYGGSGNGEYIVGKNGNTPTFYWTDSGGNNFMNATNFSASSSVGGLLNAWYHMACVREGDVFTMYINGICENSTTDATTLASTSNKLTIAIENDLSSSPFDGYLQDVRIYKGAAKYSGTTIGTQYFVPPSRNPDILPDTPSGVSGSSKLTKITEGAVTGFESNSNYLSVAASNDFVFDGDHTIELFVYHNSLSDDSVPWSTGGSGQPDQFYIGTNGAFYYGYGQTGAINSAAGTIVTGRWQHLAVSKQGTNLRMFVDGKIVASSTNHSSSIGRSSNAARIGNRTDGGNAVRGFISNLRIVKGTALYTSEFTPPKEPLTNVTNTVLLCCQSPTSAGAAPVSPNIGGLNNGTIWSDYLTTTQGVDFYTGNNYPPSNLFDGSTSTIVYGGWTDDTDDASNLIFSPPSGITVSSKLEVYVGYYSKIKVNGADYNTGGHNTGQAWVTVSDGSNFTGTLNELILENTTNANVVRAAAIRIDDSTILLDPVSAHNAKVTNFNPFNTDINTVRGQETGYATWNPLKMGTGDVSMSEGNLFWRTTSNGPDRCTYSTIGMDRGKFYWENEIMQATATAVGIANIFANQDGGPALAHNWMYYSATGQVYLDGTASSYGAAFTTMGTIIGVAFDRDKLTLEFYKNGVSQGKLTNISGLTDSETYFAMCGDSGGASQSQVRVNFGQKPFKFPPPDGFQPLNLANVRPDKVISRPDQYFGVSLWSGNGTSQSITGLQHKPDFVWLKKRAGGTARSHQLFDSVRGVHETLHSDGNSAEDTNSNRLTAFNRDGFTVGGDDGSNGSGGTFVGWTWKAGGSKNTFNVDDVGYASASNVNMSVGALNSASYNQSNRWSDDYSGATIDGSYPITQAFDGNRSTASRVSATQTAMSVDLTNITVTDRIEICGELGYITPYVSVTVDGVNHYIGGDPNTLISGSAGTASRVITGVSGALTNVTVGRVSSGRTYLSQIIVDGKILVDDNITPANVPSIAAKGCSVGTKQGFSIIRYQANSTGGSTIPHGLSQAPDFVLVKSLETAGSSNSDWTVFHKSLGGTQAVYLNQQNAAGNTGSWNNTDPNAHVITLGTAHVANLSPNHYIAYAWHNVPGLQKFGSYTGTGQTNGPFVELGFRPAIIWVKNTSSGSTNWVVFTDVIDDINPAYKRLQQNSNSAENTDASTNAKFDILSNGFKSRGGDGTFVNTNNNNYIYCAWAKAPSINLYGAQSNAK